ncbi:MAG: DUF2336 domain-containing protein [Rhodospirillales bacterium]|nr:DUF2336 domain-containing protein [Rhodospirillales bacterium]
MSGSAEEKLTYEECKKLARHKDPKVRRALAMRINVEPEVLYFLAEDRDPEVRRAAASNSATPRLADLKLASDADPQVRSGIAEKIVRLAPGLSANEQDRVLRATYETLEVLARDQIVQVRRILSDTLKDVTDAPPEVIRKLALDTEVEVAGPILQFSPVLTDEDLLEIISAGPPSKGGLGAIARRENVSEPVSDAVASTDNIGAIADLLGNHSAQIREATLDSLVERADSIQLWHAPLVGRPHLSAKSSQRLARVVADNLLGMLQERSDLDVNTLEAVKAIVQQRVSKGSGENYTDENKGGFDESLAMLSVPAALPVEVAKRLHQSGKLGENVLVHALLSNDAAFVLAGLIVRSDLGTKSIQKIIASQNPKGVVSLIWKAGLSMEFAVQVQTKLGRISPLKALKATTDGEYPLTESEMEWQLEFFSSSV